MYLSKKVGFLEGIPCVAWTFGIVYMTELEFCAYIQKEVKLRLIWKYSSHTHGTSEETVLWQQCKKELTSILLWWNGVLAKLL